ncbi:hypothetical protein CC86DRAFT_113575 [Ophiobolus disseminans]|uniref:MYND-type domain-containing protein n=1 Tax=Ophiobolus disseminans TaxID=1469910 RepID=A0A6A6ZIE4_9PLEO|nr:hypothetical protein CC86DRAFT_113575 [Ophiobolus disseminans]
MSITCGNCQGPLGPDPVQCNTCIDNVYCDLTCSMTSGSLHTSLCNSIRDIAARPSGSSARRAIHFPMRGPSPQVTWLNHLVTSASPKLVPNNWQIVQLVNEVRENTLKSSHGPSFDSLPPSTCTHCGLIIEIYYANTKTDTMDLVSNAAFRRYYKGDTSDVWQGWFLARGYEVSIGSQGQEVREPRDLSADVGTEYTAS